MSSLQEKNKFHIGSFFSTYAIYLVFAGMVILSAVMSENFLKPSNLVNILRQMSPIMIIACGETMVIIAGMTDLAPGAVLALSGCVGIGVCINTGSAILGMLTAIAIGILCGFISGIAVSRFNIPPFIATLAVMNLCIPTERPSTISVTLLSSVRVTFFRYPHPSYLWYRLP